MAASGTLAGEISSTRLQPLAVHSSSNKTLVPITEGTGTCGGDFLPNELLIALFDQHPTVEKLGPPTRLPSLNVSVAATRKAPANVWNYPKQREKLKHLVTNTPCVCGAGRDVSFLYDVSKKREPQPVQSDVLDASRPRAKELKGTVRKSFELTDTLIPEEYRIVKNKGVVGLECHDDPYATLPEDHEKHLVVFPSMKPSSRFEVLQLKKALEDMLEIAGVQDEIDQLTAPTQMHALLELIKKEQNIYNIIFHELIRQVSIECVERGELLASVRQHYAELLSKVPKQIKSLHDEVLAQRALDRRLTEELLSFQDTVSRLASELNAVKEHDKQVMQQAQQVQQDLRTALSEASKNSSILSEYRELYQLQRERLEKQVDILSDELQVWCDAAYCLAAKVIEEHSLNSTRLLCLAEKSWSRLADHFAVALCDRDMAELTTLQLNVDSWHVALDEFDEQVRSHEDDIKHQLRMVLDDLQKWIEISTESNSLVGKVNAIPSNRVGSLAEEIKLWDQTLAYVSDKYSGESVLASQEILTSLRRYVGAWTNCALRIYIRHDTESGEQHPLRSKMTHVNHQVETLLKHYSTRITGENGEVDNIQSVATGVEAWNARLKTSVSLNDQQRAQLFEQFEGWVMALSQSIASIGSLNESPTGRVDQPSDTEQTGVDKVSVVNQVRKWLKSSHHNIDSEDAKLSERVSVLHRQMIDWTTKAIISLVPSHHNLSKEARDAELMKTVSVEQLYLDAKNLSVVLTEFTKLLTRHCSQFVVMERQSRLDRGDDDADHEHLELLRLASECEEWTKLSGIVLLELTSVAEKMQTSSKDNVEGRDSKITGRSDYQPEVTAGLLESMNTDTRLKANTVSVERQDNSFEPLPPSDDTLSSEVNDVLVASHETSRSVNDAGEQLAPAVDKLQLSSVTLADLQVESADVQIASSGGGETASTDHLEVIGYDASTRTVQLSQPGQHIDSDQSPGYMAFASVQYLQHQLLVTESRAQEAEERALSAETALVEALEKLRAVERGRSPVTHSFSAASVSKSPSMTKPHHLATGKSSEREDTRILLSSNSTSLARDKSSHRNSSKVKSKKK